ncbi:hypothetical protein QQ045_011886 [Rhodiola kirilowii]
MLRQLIEQLQDQLIQQHHHHHRPSLDPSHSSQLVLLQQPPHRHQIDSPSLDELDFISANGGCYNLVLMAEKSESFKMLDPCNPQAAKRPRGRAGRSAHRSKMMDEEIWKDFPGDLFEAVIARLPVPTFFRFRSVCRKWNSILTSSSFSRQCDLVQPSQPWFYTITHENDGSAMYDPCSKKWYQVILPPTPVKSFGLPVASAGGLVCCLDIRHKKFQVLNPLTRSCKELPPLSAKVWSQYAVGMTSKGNSSTMGYKILWLKSDGEHEIYDSEKDSWSCPGSMMSSVRLPLCLNFQSQSICVGDTLYFMRSEPDGLVSYNMASGLWKQSIIPKPPHIMDDTLAECEGRIMLVGLLTKNAATCVCVWELQKMTLLWKEVDRMPNILCLEFYGKHVRMTCLGNSGLLLVSLRYRQINRLVTYNILSREWQKIPGWHKKKRQWTTRGTYFQPRPTALI